MQKPRNSMARALSHGIFRPKVEKNRKKQAKYRLDRSSLREIKSQCYLKQEH